MIWATCLSCPPSPVAGKTVLSAGSPFKALLSNWLKRKALEVIWLSAWIRVTPVSKVSSCCMAAVRALQSLVEAPVEQATPGLDALPGTTVAGRVCTPVQKTGAPATETTVGYCAPALTDLI